MRIPILLRLGLAAAAAALVGCGGGGSSPITGPTTPPAPTYSVTATVFYDENDNGQLDPSEKVRVPGVDVVIGSASAKTAAGTGQALVSGILEGPASAAVRVESLPAYFQPAPPLPVQVPGTAEVRIPLTLPIGNNHANLYLGLGDSITKGVGSSDGQGYLQKLQALLGGQIGPVEVQAWGRDGTNSAEGASVTRKTLRWYDPAYTLILYGTNDWQDQVCQNRGPAACFTIDSLRSMIEDVKDWESLAVLATVLPANPALAPAGRNQWIDDTNGRIKALAVEQNVALADLNAELKAAGNLPSLYSDDVHPNDAGYQVLAQGWMKGITRARSASASSRRRFGFRFR